MLLVISIEGLDGSGKETTTREVVNYLSKFESKGLRVMSHSFPDYSIPSGKAIKYALSGHSIGNDIEKLFTINRKSVLEDMMAQFDCKFDTVFIFDRYYHSNVFYQTLDMNEEEILKYITDLEKREIDKYKNLRVDKIFYLNTPLDISINRVSNRAISKSGSVDIYENIDHMKKVWLHAPKVIKMIKQTGQEFEIIDPTFNGSIKSPSVLGKEIGDNIIKILQKRMELLNE